MTTEALTALAPMEPRAIASTPGATGRTERMVEDARRATGD